MIIFLFCCCFISAKINNYTRQCERIDGAVSHDLQPLSCKYLREPSFATLAYSTIFPLTKNVLRIKNV